MIGRALPALVSLLIAASAAAAPFSVLSYQSGVPAAPGRGGRGIGVPGITTDFGGFFSADGAGSSVLAGSAASFTAANEFEFDSHFSLDPVGPTAQYRSVSPGNNSTTTLNFYGIGAPYAQEHLGPNSYNELQTLPGAFFLVGPFSHIGDQSGSGAFPENLARAAIGVAPGPVPSYFAPNATGGRSENDAVFVGRFTIKNGATLGGGMRLDVLASPGIDDFHELTINGDPVLFQTTSGPQYISLHAYQVNLAGPIDIQNPSNATSEGLNNGTPFGLANVIDLWVQVPGPGVASIAMLLIARRRRIES